MRNRLLENYSEDQVIEAAKKFLKLKLNLNDIPIDILIDTDSALFIYERDGEDVVDGGLDEEGIELVWVRGNKKRFCWVEFDRYDGLKRFISPKSIPIT